MKKIGLLIATVCMSTLTWAQQVPDSVRQRFKTDYPDVQDVQWKTENGQYHATYQDTGKLEHNIIYDKNGKMSGRQYQLGTNDVPSGISDYYKNNYPAEHNYKVWVDEKESGGKRYYVRGKDGTLWFDENGKFVRKDAGQNNMDEDRNKNNDMNNGSDYNNKNNNQNQDKNKNNQNMNKNNQNKNKQNKNQDMQNKNKSNNGNGTNNDNTEDKDNNPPKK